MRPGVRRSRRRHGAIRLLLAAALLPLTGVVGTAPVAAQAPPVPNQREIASAGPLTRIITTDQLNCQVARFGDVSFEFFSPNETVGNCGTLVSVGGSLTTPGSEMYGPATNLPVPFRTAYTPVSQSEVTGAGTASNPFELVTVVDLGQTGLRITQTDSYVTGADSYRTDVAIANTGSADKDLILYRAGDCYMGDDDFGFGLVDGRSVGCSATANNVPPGRVLRWDPISGPNNYIEAQYLDVWAQVNLATPLPDTCRCAERVDNGAALSWTLNVPAGRSVTRSHTLSFSGHGTTAPTSPTSVGSKVKYLALGDSYASGEGNQPYEANRSGRLCHRSTPRPPTLFDRIGRLLRRADRPQGSYPNALPGELLSLVPRSVAKRLSVVAENHACTGARTPDILQRQHPTVSAQVDQLERNADLVSLTVGGNDAGYAGALALCFIRERCFDPPTTQDVARCEALLRSGAGIAVAPFRCGDDLGREVRDRITALNPSSGGNSPLDRVYDGIDARLASLGARSQLRVVVGYPEIFPDADEVGTGDVARCRAVRARFGNSTGALSRSEMDGLIDLERLLNQAIATAAGENGFLFVAADDALDGHELCTRNPWVRGLDGRDRRSAFHPTEQGSQSVGRTLAGAVFPLLDFNVTRGGGRRGEG